MEWLRRFFRWIMELFWPGDAAYNEAKEQFKTYSGSQSKDRATLEAAMANFEIAVGQYSKRKKARLVTTLINYAVAVRRHYKDYGESPEDLDKVIRLYTKAYDSWSGQKDTDRFVVLLKALAETHFEQYRFEPSPIEPEERQQTFDKAVKYYTELKDNPASGDQKSSSRIQLGIMFRARCELEHTLDQFDIGIDHLQIALMEATIAGKELTNARDGDDEEKQAKKEALDDIKATCLLNMADSYEMRYYLAKKPHSLDDLAMAIDRNTDAKALLVPDHPDLPACLFNLARQHRLRWLQTRDQSDHNAAKQIADTAKGIQGLNQELAAKIDELLNVLQPGTLDSNLGEVPNTMDPLGASHAP